MTLANDPAEQFRDGLMTASQAAARLGMSEKTIWHYFNTGRLTRIKIGGKTRVRAAEVEALATGRPYAPDAG
jgi:excisionase family DNA binding protein